MNKAIRSLLIFIIFFLWTLTAQAYIAQLRLGGKDWADSTTYNFVLTPGDTIDLGIYITTDTYVNGFAAYLKFDTNLLELQDLNPASPGVQLYEDTDIFGIVLENSASNDTITYSALTTADSFIGDTRVAYLRFYARQIGATVPITWEFDTAYNRNTEIDTAGVDVLTGVETAYIYIKPDSVLNLRASVDVTAPGTGCVLVWDASTDTGVQGYLIYRATTDLNYSLISNLVIGTTTYTDSSALFGQTYYWVVTAADTDASTRAESDFSDSATAPYISLSKSLTKVSLNSSDTQTIPGTSWEYTFVLQSIGFDAAQYIVLDDQLDTNVIFDTNVSVSPGWQELYAHIANPDRSYTSADFDTVPTNVLWVRFKKAFFACGDTATFKIRVILK